MRFTGRRLAIIGSAAAISGFLFFWSASPSEKFHSLLLPLWILYFILAKRQLDKRSLIFGAGISLGLLGGFAMVGNAQAQLLGARLEWHEPFQKFLFTAGLFVIYSGLCAILNGFLALIPAASKLLKAPQGWWLRALRVGVALCLFAPYLYVSFNVHRFKYANATNPQLRGGLPFETASFASRDGISLSGWFIPQAGSQATILVVHGIGSNRGDLLGVAPFLHRAGFNVLLFDLRGHGDSAGHTTTFGLNEARDVEAAADWINRRNGGQPIGLYAFSMGGCAALYAMGNPAQSRGMRAVRAVVLDSTFSEFEPLARQQMQFLPEIVANPLLSMVSFYTRLEIGAGLRDIAPGLQINKIAPRPLLLIHGTKDTLISPWQARLNFERARQPKSLFWVEGAGHCACHSVAGAAYEKRVGAFFQSALSQSPFAFQKTTTHFSSLSEPKLWLAFSS